MDTYYEFKCSCICSNAQRTPYFGSVLCSAFMVVSKKIANFSYFKDKQNTWYLYLAHVHIREFVVNYN